MTNVKLLYGRGELSVDLPETSDVTLIRKPKMPKLEDPTLAVESTLSSPTASAEAVGLERVDSTARVGSSNLGILGFLINVTSEVSGKSTDSSPRP